MSFMELRDCDKCGVQFIAYSKLRFFCDDCYTLRRMNEAIQLRDWTDNSTRKQWNKAAKESRMAIMAKYNSQKTNQ